MVELACTRAAVREPLRLIFEVRLLVHAGNIVRRLIEQLELVLIRAMEPIGWNVPAPFVNSRSGIAELPHTPIKCCRARAAEGDVPQPSGRCRGDRKRGALIVPIAPQEDRLTLLADNLEA